MAFQPMSGVPEAIRRWRRGDPGALEEVYRLCSPRLASYCRLLAGPGGEDLLQETWRKALEGIEGYREDLSFPAWLASIARNLWIDQGRRERSGRLALEARGRGLEEGARGRSAEDLALREALGLLGEEDRQAVLLYHVQGLSLRESAGVLGETTWALRERLARSHRILRSALGNS